LIEDRISQASTQRTVPIVVEANGQPNADRHWALYLAPQDPRGRIAQRLRQSLLEQDEGQSGRSRLFFGVIAEFE
jgi:hypothetical protein